MPVFKLIMRSLTGSLSLVFLGSDTLLTLIRGSFAQPIAELESFLPSLLIFVSLWRSLVLFTLRELPPLSVKLFHCLLAAVQLLKL